MNASRYQCLGPCHGHITAASQDTPGAYAYESMAQGQRLASNHLQAHQVAAVATSCAGTVRTTAPGQTFTLSNHSTHDGTNPERDCFVVLSTLHHARNNLSADLKAQAAQISPHNSNHNNPNHNHPNQDTQLDDNHSNLSNPAQTPVFYRNASSVIPLATPYRASTLDGHGQQIAPKPNAPGGQTALVVGSPGQAITTDRDGRIKVQFAWQRGDKSQSRLAHPAPEGHSGAPAEDGQNASSSTWVRVAATLAPIAGANWGAAALPRVGQEVLITFIGGDIDRPVVMGAVYNGRGQLNAQSNLPAGGQRGLQREGRYQRLYIRQGNEP